MADKKFTIKEKKSIIKLIKEYWKVDVTTEEFMYEAFRNLIKNEIKPNDAFQNFENFVLEHKTLFDENTVQKVLKSANNIMYSFANKNKSEVIMLAKLQLLFDKL